MFHNLTRQYQFNQYFFVCDTVDDIAKLPSKTNQVDNYSTPTPGSTAFVIEGTDGSSAYMFGNDGEWHEIF